MGHSCRLRTFLLSPPVLHKIPKIYNQSIMFVKVSFVDNNCKTKELKSCVLMFLFKVCLVLVELYIQTLELSPPPLLGIGGFLTYIYKSLLVIAIFKIFYFHSFHSNIFYCNIIKSQYMN